TILSYIDSMSMIPGPMTVFKRKVFDVVGDYDPNNLTEDMDMGLRLQEHGFKIRTCYEAVALTDVPDTWKKLFKQRDRWYRGRIFNLMIHNNLFFNKENKSLGFFSIPYLFSLELISMVLLVRLAILFLNNALTMIASEVIAFSATNAVFVTIPHFFMTSTAIFFFFSYFFVFLYIYFSLKTVNYKPDFFDIIVILINILLYPFFITIVYGQGFFKELFGVRAKWVRVST
ncbi:MAG: glycosyltransferase family 2 protein, partial [Candidatus ainarchaeum sp.]|nr:glycosyltransferase family 2 protein [Candidatus ainarchaeum sp.]